MKEKQYLTIEDSEEEISRILRDDCIDVSYFEDILEMDDLDPDDSDIHPDFLSPVIIDEKYGDAIVFGEIRKIEEMEAKHKQKRENPAKVTLHSQSVQNWSLAAQKNVWK